MCRQPQGYYTLAPPVTRPQQSATSPLSHALLWLCAAVLLSTIKPLLKHPALWHRASSAQERAVTANRLHARVALVVRLYAFSVLTPPTTTDQQQQQQHRPDTQRRQWTCENVCLNISECTLIEHASGWQLRRLQTDDVVSLRGSSPESSG